MKDKIIAFIIGLIAGIVITSGFFLVYNKINADDRDMNITRQTQDKGERPNGEHNGNFIEPNGNSIKANGGPNKSSANSTTTQNGESM